MIAGQAAVEVVNVVVEIRPPTSGATLARLFGSASHRDHALAMTSISLRLEA